MKTLSSTFLVLIACTLAFAMDAPSKSIARLPIRELSTFKDGLAVVVCEGARPVDAAGNVVLDELPQPILGAFWPYSADPAIALTSATAASRPVTKDRAAANLRDLLEANVGTRARITEDNGGTYAGTIVSLFGDKDSPDGWALLSTDLGVKVLSIARVRDLTFDGEPKTKLPNEERVNQLILRPAWPDGKPAPEAKVGMLYVQRGFRWIPEYRVELNDNGTAHLRLQATLVNDLTDLEDTTVHLVVGVPSFAFKDKLDPMALQETLAEVARSLPQTPLSNDMQLSNAIMTQVAMPVPQSPDTLQEPFPFESGEGLREDLYTFTIPHVTLAKGERMTVPVTEFDLPYEDVFRLEIPLSPPQELQQALAQTQQPRTFGFMRQPKVMHAARLTNEGAVPLTTAPALILRNGLVAAQSTMTYTPPRARVDLDITAAVDIQVIQEDRETARTPNVLRLDNEDYQRVDIEGRIRLANYRPEPLIVEVKRYIPGQIDTAPGATFEQLNTFAIPALPILSDWYAWPYWWQTLNGIGRINWTPTLDPGKPIDLPYTWHYFTR